MVVCRKDEMTTTKTKPTTCLNSIKHATPEYRTVRSSLPDFSEVLALARPLAIQWSRAVEAASNLVAAQEGLTALEGRMSEAYHHEDQVTHGVSRSMALNTRGGKDLVSYGQEWFTAVKATEAIKHDRTTIIRSLVQAESDLKAAIQLVHQTERDLRERHHENEPRSTCISAISVAKISALANIADNVCQLVHKTYFGTQR